MPTNTTNALSNRLSNRQTQTILSQASGGVSFVSKEQMQNQITQYNQGKKLGDKIAPFNRNGQTGWPLLHWSLLSMEPSTEGLRYTPVLGGGKCHFGFIAAFNLAVMMTQMPGQVVTSTGFDPHDINLMMNEFSVSNRRFGITIMQESGAYGKLLSIQLPLGSNDANMAFTKVFRDMDHLAFLPGKSIFTIDDWNGTSYSLQEIQESINTEMAIFHEGQIYIDFGRLLDKGVRNDEVKAYFANMFKVDEFLALSKEHNHSDTAKIEPFSAISSSLLDSHVKPALAENLFLARKAQYAPLLQSLGEYERRRKKEGRYLFFDVFHMGFERAKKLDAVRVIKEAIEQNRPIPDSIHPVLKNGRLGKLVKNFSNSHGYLSVDDFFQSIAKREAKIDSPNLNHL